MVAIAVLGRRLQGPAPAPLQAVRVALYFGVVFLMSTKPGTAGALAAMGVAVVAGSVAGLALRRRRPDLRAVSRRRGLGRAGGGLS